MSKLRKIPFRLEKAQNVNHRLRVKRGYHVRVPVSLVNIGDVYFDDLENTWVFKPFTTHYPRIEDASFRKVIEQVAVAVYEHLPLHQLARYLLTGEMT